MATTDKELTARQKARREAILEAVRRLLDESGYDGVSMRQVATEAGVSPSTLYEIYDSKDTLILQSVRNYFDQIEETETGVEPGLDRLVSRLESIGSFFQSSPKQGEGVSRLLFQNSDNDLSTQVLLLNAFDARRRSLEEMVDAGQITQPPDLDLLARTLVSITWGTVLFHQRGVLGSADVTRELVRESMSVLLPHAASPRIKRRMVRLVESS